MKNKNSKRKIFQLIFLFLFLTFAFCIFCPPVFAAEFFFRTESNVVRIGQQFKINFFINTAQENINAFEGKILFSKDLLDFKEIQDGNTIVNFWIEKPKNQNGVISFSGITPGGFKGKEGLIFSVVFGAKSEGIVVFNVKDARVFLNDGKGSQAFLTVRPFEMKVSSSVLAPTQPLLQIEDTQPPESFKPEIAKNETVFEGKWFVVFSTQDKGWGIDHYEILEKEQKNSIRSLFKKEKWEVVQSPYLLKDQKLKSYIFVKAVDRAGNERVIKILPQNSLEWYEKISFWIIIILGAVIAFIIWRMIKQRWGFKNQK